MKCDHSELLQEIRDLQAENKWLKKHDKHREEIWKDRISELEWKGKVFDAMCEVGLIQFDPNIENHCYSVWGFGAWHHDQDIFKAIADAMEPPTLIEQALEQDDGK